MHHLETVQTQPPFTLTSQTRSRETQNGSFSFLDLSVHVSSQETQIITQGVYRCLVNIVTILILHICPLCLLILS